MSLITIPLSNLLTFPPGPLTSTAVKVMLPPLGIFLTAAFICGVNLFDFALYVIGDPFLVVNIEKPTTV